MQTKKEDIRMTILECARDEFMNHGYEDASMRTIAKKANTSLGNIYHYFPNKKAILDSLIKPVVQEVCNFVREHSMMEDTRLDMDQINAILEQVDFNEPEMKALLSKEFVIFMETKDPEYVAIREETLHVFRHHIAKHMHFKDGSNHFVIIVTKMLIDCIIHMVRCNECVHDKKEDIIDMFKILCRSVAVQGSVTLPEENKESPE
ncbi:TetR/AcrR family transcriptional regulator [Amedibacillus sp. YH-ame10]